MYFTLHTAKSASGTSLIWLLQVITLPYPLLLQKTSRDTLGYSLKGQVVLIDEAHNLMDAIASMNSTTVSLSQLQQARKQLIHYLQRFRNRLKGKNRVYVTQIVRVLDSLVQYLVSHNEAAGLADEGEARVADLISGKGTDQINLFKLTRYLQESKLARKVNDYHVHAKKFTEPLTVPDKHGSTKSGAISIAMPVLMQIQSFLLTLMNPSAEGRFFYVRSPETSDTMLKYALLDPTQHFRDVVEEARAVILAGGTMSPVSRASSSLQCSVRIRL